MHEYFSTLSRGWNLKGDKVEEEVIEKEEKQD